MVDATMGIAMPDPIGERDIIADMPTATVAPIEAPAAAERIHCTPRVLAIIAGVARYGVLSSEQIARLDGGSRQRVTRLLQRLVDLKLLRRIHRANDPVLPSYFGAHVFAVTAKGLRVLRAAGVELAVSPKATNVLVSHELAVADAMFAIAAAVAERPHLRLIDQPELISTMPLATRQLQRPLRLQAQVQAHQFPALRHLLTDTTKLSVEPDRLIAIARRDGASWLTASYAIELDRGGEPITTNRLRGRATWARKTIAYVSAWSAGDHRAQWGDICRSFRVLGIVPSRDRARNIIDMQQLAGAPPGLFLFTTADALRTEGALSPIWMSAKADNVALIED
jgi:hypothetical protein